MSDHSTPAPGTGQGQTFLPWQLKILELAAQGYRAKAIARRTGILVSKVTYALKSPAFIDAVAKVRDAQLATLGTTIAERILRDVPANLAFLEAVRDNELDDATPEVRERVTAAIRLLDSQLPRRTSSQQHHSGTVGVGVGVFSADEARDIVTLAQAAGVALPALPASAATIDVTPPDAR